MGRRRSDSREDRYRKERKSEQSKRRRHRSSSRSSTTSNSSSSNSDSGSSRRRKQSSRSGTRRRSRSRSYDRSRSRRSRSRSHDRASKRPRSRSQERHKSEKEKKDYRKSEIERKIIEPTISLDTKLKEEVKEAVLTVEEQITRIQAVEHIQSDGFMPQSFISTRSEKVTAVAKSEIYPSADDKAAAIVALDKGGICHPSLFVNQAEKEERWLKKLFEMRQKILREDSSI